MQQQLELAWAAGFFDGEGSTGFYVTRRGERKIGTLRVQIGQKHCYPLDRFMAAVGAGRIYGPYTNKQGNVHYEYRAVGRAGHEVVAALWPQLGRIKRRQAACARLKQITFRKGA